MCFKCIHDMMILKGLNFLDAKSVFMDGIRRRKMKNFEMIR